MEGGGSAAVLLECKSAIPCHTQQPSPSQQPKQQGAKYTTVHFKEEETTLAKKIRHKVGVIITLQSVLYLTPRDVPKIIAAT